MNVVRVNGQIWVREYIPDVGEHWIRLVRAPFRERNVATLEQLQANLDFQELAPVGGQE